MSNKNNAKVLIEQIRETYELTGRNLECDICELAQVAAFEKRNSGKEFTFSEHLQGVILAQLSNQRVWRGISRNLNNGNIQKIFCNFDSKKLKQKESQSIVNELKKIQCGNRRINQQMKVLSENIVKLESIATQSGSLDKFVSHSNPSDVAQCISVARSNFKLKEMGFTLATEYLKNVGISVAKPDTHIRRILSNERLNYFDRIPDEQQAVDAMKKLAKEADISEVYLDNVLWLFCAKDYGNICSAKQPKCDGCAIKMCVKNSKI